MDYFIRANQIAHDSRFLRIMNVGGGLYVSANLNDRKCINGFGRWTVNFHANSPLYLDGTCRIDFHYTWLADQQADLLKISDINQRFQDITLSTLAYIFHRLYEE